MNGQTINAPRMLSALDFAGGRAFVIEPGINTPCRLVVGRLLAPLALTAGDRVLLDLPALRGDGQGLALAVFDGAQLFKGLDDV